MLRGGPLNVCVWVGVGLYIGLSAVGLSVYGSVCVWVYVSVCVCVCVGVCLCVGLWVRVWICPGGGGGGGVWVCLCELLPFGVRPAEPTGRKIGVKTTWNKRENTGMIWENTSFANSHWNAQD